jgi:hypothetical protein
MISDRDKALSILMSFICHQYCQDDDTKCLSLTQFLKSIAYLLLFNGVGQKRFNFL